MPAPIVLIADQDIILNLQPVLQFVLQLREGDLVGDADGDEVVLELHFDFERARGVSAAGLGDVCLGGVCAGGRGVGGCLG